MLIFLRWAGTHPTFSGKCSFLWFLCGRVSLGVKIHAQLIILRSHTISWTWSRGRKLSTVLKVMFTWMCTIYPGKMCENPWRKIYLVMIRNFLRLQFSLIFSLIVWCMRTVHSYYWHWMLCEQWWLLWWKYDSWLSKSLRQWPSMFDVWNGHHFGRPSSFRVLPRILQFWINLYGMGLWNWLWWSQSAIVVVLGEERY